MSYDPLGPCNRCGGPYHASWHGRHPLCLEHWMARLRGWLRRNVKAFRRINPGEPLPEFYAVRAAALGMAELLDAAPVKRCAGVAAAPAWQQRSLFETESG